MNVQYVDVKNVKPAEWRTTYVLLPDLALIRKSIEQFGWIYPIVAMKSTGIIIDGFHRWLLADDDPSLLVEKKIPVQWVDCDEFTAMAMHIRLNRGRGSVVARHLSSTIVKMIEMCGSENKVQAALNLPNEEFELLSQPKLIKSKKLAEHAYSRAWVPVEVAPDSVISVPEIEFEKPPSPDR